MVVIGSTLFYLAVALFVAYIVISAYGGYAHGISSLTQEGQ